MVSVLSGVQTSLSGAVIRQACSQIRLGTSKWPAHRAKVCSAPSNQLSHHLPWPQPIKQSQRQCQCHAQHKPAGAAIPKSSTQRILAHLQQAPGLISETAPALAADVLSHITAIVQLGDLWAAYVNEEQQQHSGVLVSSTQGDAPSRDLLTDIHACAAGWVTALAAHAQHHTPSWQALSLDDVARLISALATLQLYSAPLVQGSEAWLTSSVTYPSGIAAAGISADSSRERASGAGASATAALRSTARLLAAYTRLGHQPSQKCITGALALSGASMAAATAAAGHIPAGSGAKVRRMRLEAGARAVADLAHALATLVTPVSSQVPPLMLQAATAGTQPSSYPLQTPGSLPSQQGGTQPAASPTPSAAVLLLASARQRLAASAASPPDPGWALTVPSSQPPQQHQLVPPQGDLKARVNEHTGPPTYIPDLTTWLQLLQQCSLAHMPAMSAATFAQLLPACAKLGLCPSAQWLQAAGQQLLKHLRGAVGTQPVAMITTLPARPSTKHAGRTQLAAAERNLSQRSAPAATVGQAQVAQQQRLAQALPTAAACEAWVQIALWGKQHCSRRQAGGRVLELHKGGVDVLPQLQEAVLGVLQEPHVHSLRRADLLHLIWSAAVLTSLRSHSMQAGQDTESTRSLKPFAQAALMEVMRVPLLRLHGYLPLMAANQLAQALHAAALLGVRPYRAWMSDWQRHLLRRTHTSLSLPASLQLIWALAVLHPRPKRLAPPLTSLVVAALTRHAASMSKQDLQLALSATRSLYRRLRGAPLQRLVHTLTMRLQYVHAKGTS